MRAVCSTWTRSRATDMPEPLPARRMRRARSGLGLRSSLDERYALSLVLEGPAECPPAVSLALVGGCRDGRGVYDGDVSGRDAVCPDVRCFGFLTLGGGFTREGCLHEIRHAESRVVRSATLSCTERQVTVPSKKLASLNTDEIVPVGFSPLGPLLAEICHWISWLM